MIGAPGSVARYLDDLSRDAAAEPLPARWCVFTYRGMRGGPSGGPILAGSGATKEAAETIKRSAESVHGWAVVVDVSTYNCQHR